MNIIFFGENDPWKIVPYPESVRSNAYNLDNFFKKFSKT